MAAPPTEGTLKLGQPKKSQIRPGDDVDFYKVQLKDNNLYTFEARGSGSGGNTLDDPILGLFDRNGRLIRENDSFNGNDPLIEYRADRTGTFYVGIAASDGAPGSYTIGYDLADGAPDDSSNDGKNTELKIKIGQKVLGEIGAPGDEDWYRIELQAGKTYTAYARNRNIGDAPAFLADVIIRRSNGAVLDNDREYDGFDPTVPGVDNEFVAPYTGVYFLDVRDINDNSRGNYSILINRGPQFS